MQLAGALGPGRPSCTCCYDLRSGKRTVGLVRSMGGRPQAKRQRHDDIPSVNQYGDASGVGDSTRAGIYNANLRTDRLKFSNYDTPELELFTEGWRGATAKPIRSKNATLWFRNTNGDLHFLYDQTRRTNSYEKNH